MKQPRKRTGSPTKHSTPKRAKKAETVGSPAEQRTSKRARPAHPIEVESDSNEEKMSKKDRTSSSGTRWKAPRVYYSLQTVFCVTKEDFYTQYGLGIEGKDPRLLRDSDVEESDWLLMFKQTRDTGAYRMKCSSIRAEQFQDVLIFYNKVYQKRPTNMEFNISFARAYVLQFSPSVVRAGKEIAFVWAIVAEDYNNDLRKSGYFENHLLRWKVNNAGVESAMEDKKGLQSQNEETPQLRAVASSTLALLHADHVSDSLKVKALIEDVGVRMREAKDAYAVCEKKLEDAKVQELSEEKFAKARMLVKTQIETTQSKLASLPLEDSITRTTLSDQLASQESMLLVLGGESTNSVDLTMIKVDMELQADVVKELEMQYALLVQMLRLAKGQQVCLFPSPPLVSHTIDNLSIVGKCAGCGQGFNVDEALMLVILPCKHPYHSMCFATLCTFRDKCTFPDCTMVIPHLSVAWEAAPLTSGRTNPQNMFSSRKMESSLTAGDTHMQDKAGEDNSSSVDLTNLRNAIDTGGLSNIEKGDTQDLNYSETQGLEERIQDETDNLPATTALSSALNEEIADVLKDLESEGHDPNIVGDDSPLGHLLGQIARKKGRAHTVTRASPAKKWKVTTGTTKSQKPKSPSVKVGKSRACKKL